MTWTAGQETQGHGDDQMDRDRRGQGTACCYSGRGAGARPEPGGRRRYTPDASQSDIVQQHTATGNTSNA